MPATTGISAIPSSRPGFEAQAGIVPGYYLSQAANKPNGAPVAQLSSLLEPDRWLGIPGLIIGARMYGPDRDLYIEPYLGFRHRVDESVALAVAGFASSGHATERLASYHATRVGGEAIADVTILKAASWLGIHGQGAVSGTYVAATGTYCVDAAGVGRDCDTSANAANTFVDGSLDGVYVAATGTLALDVGRLSHGPFHSARVAFLGSAGKMPRVRNGSQQAGDSYATLGLTLTLGLGAAK